MAYDPNDPADKVIVDKLIADAVNLALEEAREEHEVEVAGLKAKRTELLGKLAKARGGEGGGDTGEIERLENELETVKGDLRKAQSELRETKRQLTAAEGERDNFRQAAETETNFSREMVIENGLTAALLEANVAEHHIPAVTALLTKGGQVEVKAGTDGKRQAFVGDKSLGDYVKEWAASEAGKHYVKAPANSGGGAGGAGQGGGSGKKISEMNEAERIAHYNAVGQAEFEKQVAAEKPAA